MVVKLYRNKNHGSIVDLHEKDYDNALTSSMILHDYNTITKTEITATATTAILVLLLPSSDCCS